MANKLFKELLKIDNTAPRALHHVLKFDFMKDFYIFSLDQKFTANQILKEAAAAGHNPTASVIAILTQPTPDYIFPNHLFLATLQTGDRFYIDYSGATIPYYIGGKHTTVDDYHSRGTFENLRKNNTRSFVICQKRADLATDNPHPVNLESRFKIEKINKYGYQNSSASYIGDVETRRTDDNGSRYTYNQRGMVIYRGRDEYQNINELFDKSGYIVNRKRAELKRAAAARRAEKASAAFKATDNRETIKALRTAAEAKKAEYIKRLTEATTGDEISKAAEGLRSYNGLGGIIKDIENVEARDAAKDYPSINSFNNDIERINKKLNDL